MSDRFDGKSVLVTGGTDGIGLAAARRIAAEGGTVAVTGVGEKSLAAARNALPEGVLVLDNDASDEQLGYVTTDDSFTKILDDVAGQVADAQRELHHDPRRPKPRSVSDWIDELSARLTGEDDRTR